MHIKDRKNISNFWVAGINYKKTNTAARGLYAINNDQYGKILSAADGYHLNEIFILSTCNRTEIYGFADKPEQLINLLCDQCDGDKNTFSEICYTKNGMEAAEHLFHVGAGLDSQILGDYEILGQIKKAGKFAKEQGFIGAFTERLINSVIQSSKAVKTNTELSGGTVSVSFAAVQYIREHVPDASDKKIVLFGTGKIGQITCKNIVDYLGTKNITLINRTEEKATELAAQLGLSAAPVSALKEELRDAGIILVSTNADEPVILKEHLEGRGEKLVLDLSVPCNVAIGARQLPNVTFADVDTLSKINDETLQKRNQEVPKAIEILKEHFSEFKDWYEMRRHVPILKEVKNKLKELHTHHGFLSDNSALSPVAAHEEKIQKVVNVLAIKMRNNNTPGCHYIEAINEYIA